MAINTNQPCYILALRARLVCGIDPKNGMTMFGMGLFLGIPIPIGILIPL
jgi:hypothetical protein